MKISVHLLRSPRFNLRYTFDLGVATVIVKILAVGFFGFAYYFSERSPIPDENVDLDVIH